MADESDTPRTIESISSTTESWSSDIELILSNVLFNSNLLLIEHKKLYFYNKELFKYFKIPLIILASLNSVFSVGLNNFINQNIVSVLTCLIISSLIPVWSGILELSPVKSPKKQLFDLFFHHAEAVVARRWGNRSYSSCCEGFAWGCRCHGSSRCREIVRSAACQLCVH